MRRVFTIQAMLSRFVSCDFDRGTLLLEGVLELPAGLDVWFQYDPRVDAYRAQPIATVQLIGPLETGRQSRPALPAPGAGLRARDDALSTSTGGPGGLAGSARSRRRRIADRGG